MDANSREQQQHEWLKSIIMAYKPNNDRALPGI